MTAVLRIDQQGADEAALDIKKIVEEAPVRVGMRNREVRSR